MVAEVVVMEAVDMVRAGFLSFSGAVVSDT